MPEKLSDNEIKEILAKLKDQYEKYAVEYSPKYFNKKEFEERRLDAVKKEMNMEAFVLAEVFGTAPSAEPASNGLVPWRGASPLSYYVPGYVALAAAAVGLIMIPAHLASYRERGVLRRFRAAQ